MQITVDWLTSVAKNPKCPTQTKWLLFSAPNHSDPTRLFRCPFSVAIVFVLSVVHFFLNIRPFRHHVCALSVCIYKNVPTLLTLSARRSLSAAAHPFLAAHPIRRGTAVPCGAAHPFRTSAAASRRSMPRCFDVTSRRQQHAF